VLMGLGNMEQRRDGGARLLHPDSIHESGDVYLDQAFGSRSACDHRRRSRLRGGHASPDPFATLTLEAGWDLFRLWEMRGLQGHEDDDFTRWPAQAGRPDRMGPRPSDLGLPGPGRMSFFVR
jgi:hypothetical protein